MMFVASLGWITWRPEVYSLSRSTWPYWLRIICDSTLEGKKINDNLQVRIKDQVIWCHHHNLVISIVKECDFVHSQVHKHVSFLCHAISLCTNRTSVVLHILVDKMSSKHVRLHHWTYRYIVKSLMIFGCSRLSEIRQSEGQSQQNPIRAY